MQALLLSGTTLYVGGAFGSIAGEPRNDLAALDTTQDIDNATVFNPDADNNVLALALSGTTLYAGGTFSAMGGEGTVARWFEARPRLMGGDFTHPTWQGSEIVGALINDALIKAYEEYKRKG